MRTRRGFQPSFDEMPSRIAPSAMVPVTPGSLSPGSTSPVVVGQVPQMGPIQCATPTQTGVTPTSSPTGNPTDPGDAPPGADPNVLIIQPVTSPTTVLC